MGDLQEVLSRLPRLAPQELEQVELRLKALRTISPVTAPLASSVSVPSLDWLLEGFYDELEARGMGVRRLPHSLIQRIAPRYDEQSASLRQKWEKGLHSYRQRLALGQLAARALTDYLCPPAPICLRTMLVNVRFLPEALDASYPGYLEAGMIPSLVRGSLMPSTQVG